MTMWSVTDANAEDPNEEIWCQPVSSDLKPAIGELFEMMRDHRGPYDDEEILHIRGRIIDVQTLLSFGKTNNFEEVHVVFKIDMEKFVVWDAEKGTAVRKPRRWYG